MAEISASCKAASARSADTSATASLVSAAHSSCSRRTSRTSSVVAFSLASMSRTSVSRSATDATSLAASLLARVPHRSDRSPTLSRHNTDALALVLRRSSFTTPNRVSHARSERVTLSTLRSALAVSRSRSSVSKRSCWSRSCLFRSSSRVRSSCSAFTVEVSCAIFPSAACLPASSASRAVSSRWTSVTSRPFVSMDASSSARHA
mmetsp:Transcript_6434/g.29009  ORF Transcript_6434/g.29009 Transcript_6434/m.29009 type:complete len:206 (-) Transcript_6434:1715-2332(-)